MLVGLRKVLEAMKTEGEGGCGGAEVEEVRKENERLKKENAKQRYRIDHLVTNLRALMEAQEKQ